MTLIAGYCCFSVRTVGHTPANKVTVLYVPDCDCVKLLTDTVIQRLPQNQWRLDLYTPAFIISIPFARLCNDCNSCASNCTSFTKLAAAS